MIGLDTNVLVRVFAGDNPAQAARVIRLLDHELGDERVYINAIVLVEFAWTMRRVYRWDRDWVLKAINRIVDHRLIQVEDKDAVRDAVQACFQNGADFADHYIGLRNLAHGCRVTLTFDKEAAVAPGFAELTV
jgi:predicted nucleic-acid-binding protein